MIDRDDVQIVVVAMLALAVGFGVETFWPESERFTTGFMEDYAPSSRTIVVTDDGSDENDCTPDAPCATLAKGIAIAQTSSTIELPATATIDEARLYEGPFFDNRGAAPDVIPTCWLGGSFDDNRIYAASTSTDSTTTSTIGSYSASTGTYTTSDAICVYSVNPGQRGSQWRQ